MAAQAIVKHYKNRKIILVYNSFADKKYEQILTILSPIIKRVEVLHVENQRGMSKKEIVDICRQMNIEVNSFNSIDDSEEYLVFGSFVVVEKFMKDYFEK